MDPFDDVRVPSTKYQNSCCRPERLEKLNIPIAFLLRRLAVLNIPPSFVSLLYAIAVMVHCVAMYFNRLQIMEHSKGIEGLFTGDSEFRKATLILMGTWFPFPIWCVLSPEGLQNITQLNNHHRVEHEGEMQVSK